VDKNGAKTLVCSPLSVEAETFDADSESWGRLLVWKDRKQHVHKWAMPMDLVADSTALLKRLLSGGVVPGTGREARSLLLQYILTENPGRSAVCVPIVGWHGRTYVFPDSAIPGDAAEQIIYQTSDRGEHFYNTAGTLADWRESIGRKCAGNSRLVFAVSAAFAGPLLRPLNVEGGGFHLVGTSSSGKSTVQWVAGSVCGGGHGAHGFARSWRFTQNALESMAELHNDGLLILDEIREIPDAKDLDSIVYMLANGSGKGRMTKTMTAQRTLNWQLLLLSSGEIKLSEYAASAGSRIKAGAEVRLLNIPADAGAGLGIFEDIHEAASARVFAERLKAAAAKIYGIPLRTFLEKWVLNWEANYKQVETFVTTFITQHLPPGAAPEVGRALRRVALVAAAGELATSMGITGWRKNEASKAAAICFKAWIQERGGTGQADMEAGMRQVKAFLEANSCRFQSIVTEERVIDRVGFWRKENKEVVFLAFPEAFRDQICQGFDYRMIAREMRANKLLLEADGDNLARKERLPGFRKTVRMYAIPGRILGDEDDDESE
jgi:putative DNA primase/helicase